MYGDRPPVVLENDNLELAEKAFQEYEADFTTVVISSFTSPIKPEEHTAALMSQASALLHEHGFKFTTDEYHVECHWMHSEGGFDRPPFGWHIDDGGPVNYNTVAALFYVKKDEGLEGGNLLWNTREYSDGNETLIPIKTGSIVLIEGNVPHCPQKIKGFGERQLIVIFYKSIR